MVNYRPLNDKISSLFVRRLRVKPYGSGMVWSQTLHTKNDTKFQLTDVPRLTVQWMSPLTAVQSTESTNHVLKIEEIFKKSDKFIA